MSWRRYVGLAVRSAVGVAIAIAVARTAGAEELWGTLVGVRLPWLGAALALVVVAVVLSAYRWGLLLAAAGVRLPLLQLVWLYVAGLFAGNFLPSSIGGDLVRLWAVDRSGKRTPEAAASVVAERLTGGWGLAVASAAALFTGGAATGPLRPVVAALIGVMALLAMLLFIPGWMASLVGWIRRRRLSRFAEGVSRGAAAMSAYRHRPGLLLAVTAWAVLFQAVVAGVNFMLLGALGQFIHPLTCFGLTALALAVTTVPVSIGGLGVREAAYVHLFGTVGVPGDLAVAASLLFGAAVTLVSLPGGFWLATAGIRTMKEEQACPPSADSSC